jgi:hypothetical protein
MPPSQYLAPNSTYYFIITPGQQVVKQVQFGPATINLKRIIYDTAHQYDSREEGVYLQTDADGNVGLKDSGSFPTKVDDLQMADGNFKWVFFMLGQDNFDKVQFFPVGLTNDGKPMPE